STPSLGCSIFTSLLIGPPHKKDGPVMWAGRLEDHSESWKIFVSVNDPPKTPGDSSQCFHPCSSLQPPLTFSRLERLCDPAGLAQGRKYSPLSNTLPRCSGRHCLQVGLLLVVFCKRPSSARDDPASSGKHSVEGVECV